MSMMNHLKQQQSTLQMQLQQNLRMQELLRGQLTIEQLEAHQRRLAAYGDDYAAGPSAQFAYQYSAAPPPIEETRVGNGCGDKGLVYKQYLLMFAYQVICICGFAFAYMRLVRSDPNSFQVCERVQYSDADVCDVAGGSWVGSDRDKFHDRVILLDSATVHDRV